MKAFSFVVLTILGACLAFAKPDYNKVYYSNNIAFTITPSHTSTITGANPNYKSDTLNIPNYFTVEKERYFVDGILDGAFANNNDIKKIIISSAVKINFHIGYGAFENCKNLDSISLGAKKISCDIDAFKKANTNLKVTGNGVPSFVEDISIRYLQNWGLPIGMAYQYDREAMKTDLYRLASHLKDEFSLKQTADEGNAASFLAIKAGYTGGFARAYRNLALLMGVTDREILVIGDRSNKRALWNYVKIDDKAWYHDDVVFSILDDIEPKSSDLFLNNADYSKKLGINVYDLVVYLDKYGYNREMGSRSTTSNLDNYLNNNGLGPRA